VFWYGLLQSGAADWLCLFRDFGVLVRGGVSGPSGSLGHKECYCRERGVAGPIA